MKSSYRQLFVWREAVSLADQIFAVSDTIRATGRFGLASQMERAAVSIGSNIAEGQSRSSRRDWRRYLEIARGSSWELDTQLEIARRRQFVTEALARKLRDRINVIGAGLNQLIAYAERQAATPRSATRRSRQLNNFET